jgi:hypothetical protein
MAKNGIETQYDDAGFPSTAAFTLPLTITTALTGQVIKPGAGRLIRVAVNTALVGSGGTLVFWDNTGAGSGTPLYTLTVATGVLGYLMVVDMPAVNGIYMTNPSGTVTAGQITVGYS